MFSLGLRLGSECEFDYTHPKVDHCTSSLDKMLDNHNSLHLVDILNYYNTTLVDILNYCNNWISEPIPNAPIVMFLRH